MVKRTKGKCKYCGEEMLLPVCNSPRMGYAAIVEAIFILTSSF